MCVFVCIAGMPSLWMDTVWRSFARRWASHAINPPPSSLKPSREKAFRVIVCYCHYPPSTKLCSNLPKWCRVCVLSAAEDKLGWHAKPLPKDMAEMVMKDLQSRITNSSKHLYPPAPIEDSPPVSLRNIRMPSAPSYKAGEKVCHLYTNTDFIHILILSLSNMFTQCPLKPQRHIIEGCIKTNQQTLLMVSLSL